MIEWEKLLTEAKVEYWSNSGGSTSRWSNRCRAGFIQVDCPFCLLNHGLGLAESGNTCICWRCGSHSPINSISELLNVGKSDAFRISKGNQLNNIEAYRIKKKNTVKIKRNEKLELPEHTSLRVSGAKYIESRGFDVDKFISQSGVVQGKKDTEYDGFIIFPIYMENILVSYVARDITGGYYSRYKICNKEDELIEHKSILAGYDECDNEDVIVVEGIFDRFKFPEYSCLATLGVTFSNAQISLLRKKYKRVFVMYDGEVEANKQANKLVQELSIRNVDAYNIQLASGDPAELSYIEAEGIRNELFNL